MRVAFIVEKFPNISETFILDEIVGLIRRGLDVDVYALRRGTAADIHPAYAKYRLRERTVYGVPAVRDRLGRLLAAVPATLQMLRRNPAAFVICALTRKRGIQSRTFVSLARAFVDSDRTYDIVHAHFGPNGVRAQVLRAAHVFRAPLVTTFHGYDATSFVTDHGSSAYRDLAARGDRFLAVSQSMAKAMRSIGFPTERTSIMPLGVDCSTFTANTIDEQQHSVRVVSIGRFVEKKGLEFGIRAVAEAHARYPDLTYDIVGDGDLRASLESTVAQLGAGGFITFHGYKNQDEIGALLRGSDIMLAPSVTAANGDMESMPIVIKEAMARGLPVVSTRHAGIPEIVVDGVTGLLADERDHKALAQHLVSLATDGRRRHEFGGAARSVIESKFDNERLIDDLVSLYREVVATKNVAAPVF